MSSPTNKDGIRPRSEPIGAAASPTGNPWRAYRTCRGLLRFLPLHRPARTRSTGSGSPCLRGVPPQPSSRMPPPSQQVLLRRRPSRDGSRVRDASSGSLEGRFASSRLERRLNAALLGQPRPRMECGVVQGLPVIPDRGGDHRLRRIPVDDRLGALDAAEQPSSRAAGAGPDRSSRRGPCVPGHR